MKAEYTLQQAIALVNLNAEHLHEHLITCTSCKDMTTTVNTYQLEHFLLEELTTWYEWLPNTPISQIGGELAMEAFATVNFRHRASLVLSRLQLAG